MSAANTAAARPNPATGTVVTYPAGSLRETATVAQVLPDPRPGAAGRHLVFTDVTPFHPLDPLWPDQPADHGVLRAGGCVLTVHDTLTAARRAGGALMVDAAVDARRAEPGVAFSVAHVVDAHPAVVEGAEVVLEVDEVRRRRLSAAHTACHLLAYALNEIVHGLWRKPVASDSRGHYDFDAVTCVSTRHDVDGSYDGYRLGRSLRKRGFDAATFLDGLPEIMDAVNRKLACWVDHDAPVRIDTDGPALADHREWVCEIPGGTAHMPCGGTHVRRLGEIGSMTASATFDAAAGSLHIVNRVLVVD